MRKKLIRIQASAEASNLIQEGKPLYKRIKGSWHSYFGNDHPIILELGCGKGDYTISLAQRYPTKNFIGIDIKGARLWVGSKAGFDLSLMNVAFLRANIAFITDFFEKGEVAELYITFPDPYPRDKDAKRRLISPSFLALYENILTRGAALHLKTDNKDLFTYAVDTLGQSVFSLEKVVADIYNHLPEESIHRTIQTFYEKRFLKEGAQINYLMARLS